MNIIEEHDFTDPSDPLYWASRHPLSMEKILSVLGINHVGLERELEQSLPGFSPTTAEVFYSSSLFPIDLRPLRRSRVNEVRRKDMGLGVWFEARYIDDSHSSGVAFPNDLSDRRFLMLYRNREDPGSTEIFQPVATLIEGPPGDLVAVGMMAERERPCGLGSDGCHGVCSHADEECTHLGSFGSGGECHGCNCEPF